MELTKENEKRRREFIAEYAAKSKARGDYWWQRAEALGACGDWTPADEGMHWSDNN